MVIIWGTLPSTMQSPLATLTNRKGSHDGHHIAIPLPFKVAYARRPTPDDDDGAHSPGNATLMAIYLQTKERECVKALVDAVHTDGRSVGGIIYDGILVEAGSAAEVESSLTPSCGSLGSESSSR